MKKSTIKLIEQIQSVVIKSMNPDVSKEQKDLCKQELALIYDKLKEIDPDFYYSSIERKKN
tara:strand:- start:249 stop:431 length:183 start_codon:yes stop_codon:yes gene_type:complete